MSIKLALLKSGDQVIANIKEYVDQNEKVVSLLFENPYVVKFLTSEFLAEDIQLEEVSHKVSFSPWIVMSEDKNMTVPLDWVVTIVEPIDWVKKSYEDKMNQSTEGVNPDPPNIERSIFQSVDNLEDVSSYVPSCFEPPEDVVNIWQDAMTSTSGDSSEEFKSIEVIQEEKND